MVSEENANFYCSITSFFCSLSDCTDGELLLYDGVSLSTNHSNGTVLVCLDNEYGTVCDDWWDPLDATVVCSQLGFSANGMYVQLYQLLVLMYVILSQVLSRWSGVALAVLPTGLSSLTMWCVLEEKETSQNVVTPPSATATYLSWLEYDVKVSTKYQSIST